MITAFAAACGKAGAGEGPDCPAEGPGFRFFGKDG